MSFGTRRTKVQLKQRVKDHWGAWRLILSEYGNFTHDYVFHHMTPQEIDEANIALDIHYAEIKKKIRKK